MFEALLYIFFSPFAHEYMRMRRASYGLIDTRGPRFLYIYGPFPKWKIDLFTFCFKAANRPPYRTTFAGRFYENPNLGRGHHRNGISAGFRRCRSAHIPAWRIFLNRTGNAGGKTNLLRLRLLLLPIHPGSRNGQNRELSASTSMFILPRPPRTALSWPIFLMKTILYLNGFLTYT